MQYTNYISETTIAKDNTWHSLKYTQTKFQTQGLPFNFLSYLPSNTVVRAGAKQIELNSM